ncbi:MULTISPECIES: heparan-alpha-glucosaminide N-acetyltransferase domain-containing protein [unclassified Mucilaginibacter]|uniref:acyltransferase family protein n=1 Tax=unclassified Mucilaginibacter TaxID=2617802 RepID=UPI002AC8B8C9|nr:MULTISPECIES: heparan-alpha-glucosaminide N-acetyltransferase domain-containing protein [unclassified Mucilaginibacter]MEB0262176.1 heparan-alpha-glucosaminide N-acetyltransferase domain-containing protein [Mucilaginibacter sp. 10I4]MEB0277036.1 heparan-alpha-glucosaminide N-acetyltransferase domain-containing protein [Mucilaginibacter sp. 10B2]MEB0302651.1 heparan-alpha-glucosaminide N-acetyltransferase domain-containing protein [Mucilaginibacter sp. 5C4]WPX25137.1 heparan-alpha-glucosamini
MSQKPERFLSLDVFRGLTICFMIIVNTPGSGATAYAPLEHAAWFGFTPTDLVFPSFLFAVGNAMSFTMKKFDGQSTGSVLYKILKRGLLICLIGYLMSWFPFVDHGANGWAFRPVSGTRILGVLQRIGLCYIFASLIIHFVKNKTSVIVISILLLVGYQLLLLGFGDPTAPYGMLTNAGTYLDKFVMGDSHLYHGEGVAFDPEGILSTLPAIVNVIVGYYAGKFIQEKGKGYETIARLALMGCVFIFIALTWNMSFPIGKKLWSSPFTLLTTGIDMVMIAAFIYVVEVRAWNKYNWTSFFTTVGKNPLAIYILSEVLIISFWMIKIGDKNFVGWINDVFYQKIAPGAFGSLLFAITYMLLCWCVGKVLDNKKIYIRV